MHLSAEAVKRCTDWAKKNIQAQPLTSYTLETGVSTHDFLVANRFKGPQDVKRWSHSHTPIAEKNPVALLVYWPGRNPGFQDWWPSAWWGLKVTKCVCIFWYCLTCTDLAWLIHTYAPCSVRCRATDFLCTQDARHFLRDNGPAKCEIPKSTKWPSRECWTKLARLCRKGSKWRKRLLKSTGSSG